jgi:hypothetical protein
VARYKYANAEVTKASVGESDWDHIRRQALAPAMDFRQKTAKVILQEYEPKDFLLTHCTIIASVDCEPVNQPLGRSMVDGFQIDRKYADYYVTPQSAQYINNNNDCWERKLLLACFKTFIGAENYVEHIQIPEMSKGKIIDAAARNIGDSIYVDILIATNRKHGSLCEAITTGKIGTLSMGCSVEFTTCTKCGNVAEDETHLCPHIRYFKGKEFVDEFGNTRKIAELCGHIEAEPGSVKFIEASWVANPAFTGAVLRNILNPEEVQDLGKKMQIAFAQQTPRSTMDLAAMHKAARSVGAGVSVDLLRLAQDQGDDQGQSQGQSQDAPPPAPAPVKDPLHKAVGDLADVIREQAIEKIRQEIGQQESAKLQGIPEDQNDTLIKSAMKDPKWRRIGQLVLSMYNNSSAARTILAGLILHKSGGWSAVKKGRFTGRQILAVSRVIDKMTRRSSMAGEGRVYQTVIAVGGMSPYGDVETYLAACRQVLGRPLTGTESGALLEKGRLYSLGS